MNAYIARQPIFDVRRHVVGYELLYRDEESPQAAQFLDGTRATCRLLSDAMTAFGLKDLTNAKPAFINFTDHLILNDFPQVADPSDIVIEILEDISISDELLEKLRDLKARGYQLALDDYVGDSKFDVLIPMVDIIKVDFIQADNDVKEHLSTLRKRYPQLSLLAEKVETEQDFLRAKELGYQFFQGFFFARPQTLTKKLQPLAATSYGRLLHQMNMQGGLDFRQCAKIIHQDTVLTYHLLKKAQTFQYYRGNRINKVLTALVMLGAHETRRWIILMLARENNVTNSEELVRHAYMRGLFATALMRHISPHREDADNAFLLGMFSLLGDIFGCDTEELLENVEINDRVRQALLSDNEEDEYRLLLRFIQQYEAGSVEIPAESFHLYLSDREITSLYLECVVQADKDFNMA